MHIHIYTNNRADVMRFQNPCIYMYIRKTEMIGFQNQCIHTFTRTALFEAFLPPCSKVGSGAFQKDVLKHFWPEPQKWLQEGSRRPFGSISGLRLKSRSRRPPGSRFEAFLATDSKVVPGGFQVAVLNNFWPRAQK